jgi:amidase
LRRLRCTHQKVLFNGEFGEDFPSLGSARPLEDPTRIAYRELVRWMVADCGFDQWDAYMLLSGRVRLGNFVDPKHTVGAAILKKYLSRT